jgi:hypothetical protein
MEPVKRADVLQSISRLNAKLTEYKGKVASSPKSDRDLVVDDINSLVVLLDKLTEKVSAAHPDDDIHETWEIWVADFLAPKLSSVSNGIKKMVSAVDVGQCAYPSAPQPPGFICVVAGMCDMPNAKFTPGPCPP